MSLSKVWSNMQSLILQKYLITMKVIKFARIFDKIMYSISNNGLRYAITNGVIKYAVTNISIWITVANYVVINAIRNDIIEDDITN